MSLLHGVGFSESERVSYVPMIVQNVIASIGALAEYSLNCKANIEEEKFVLDPMYVEIAQDMVAFANNTERFTVFLKDETKYNIQSLWNQEPIKRIFEYRRSNIQIPDSAAFFLDRLSEIFDEQFVPGDEDMLRVRVRTTGVVETSFEVAGKAFRIIDVGGQRSERRKWIRWFDGIHGLIFLVAISEYDQTIWEDASVNRMDEALALFEEIVNKDIFKETPVILFLNKMDLFQIKFPRAPLSVCFDDWNDDWNNDVEKAQEFILEKFAEKVKDPSKVIYPHFTTATNSDNVKSVFLSVRQHIVQKSLEAAGMLSFD